MMIACAGGQIEAARLLLQARAEVDCSSADGTTPLLCACERKKLDMVDFLLAAGVDMEKATFSDLFPLAVASILGHDAW